MKHKVTFEAEMDENDVGAMHECFAEVMENEMHITCENLVINPK